jgi:glyoxylase-like metal-dependent hydrolase (beta-lactamase superfamily II)
MVGSGTASGQNHEWMGPQVSTDTTPASEPSEEKADESRPEKTSSEKRSVLDTGPTWGKRGIEGGPEQPDPLVPLHPIEVAPSVTRILAPNPGLMTGPGTNTYVFRSGKHAVVIDPGPLREDHLEAVSAAVQGLVVEAVLITHHHPDHAEGLRALADAISASAVGPNPPLVAGAAGPNSSDRVVDVVIGEGDKLQVGEEDLLVLETPGHSSDHLCFFVPKRNLIFTGDHLMGGNTSVVAPPDGNMSAYLDSLSRLLQLPLEIALPGHGQPVREPHAACRWYLSHRAERERLILQTVANSQGPVSIGKIVEAVYTDVPKAAHAVAAYSVWAHLEKLQSENKVRRVGGEGIESHWTAT